MLIKELIAQIRFEVDEASYQGTARSLGVIKGLIKLVEQGTRINFDLTNVNRAAAALTNLSRTRLGAASYGVAREGQKQDGGGESGVRALTSIHKVEADSTSLQKTRSDLKSLERPIRLRLNGGREIKMTLKPLRDAVVRTHTIGVNVDDRGSARRLLRQLKAAKKVRELVGGGNTAVFKEGGARGFGRTFLDWNRGLLTTSKLLSRAGGQLRYLAGFAGVSISLRQYIAMSDRWKTIEGQIKNVIKDESRLAEIEDKLYASAARTRQSYAETAGLFTSVTRNAQELGKSTEEVLAFAEDVSNALLLGGGGKASQQAALVQLGQALGSGVLRGDELNSIMEQAPRLAQTIAQGMGIGIGQLRQYGREGKITARQVFDAVRSQSDELKKGISNIPWTVQQALGRVSDAMGRTFFNIEKEFGLADKLSKAISAVADVFDTLTANSRLFAASLRLAAIYAGLFLAYTKRAAIVSVLQTIISLLGVTRIGFHGAAAAAGVFQAAAIRAGLASAGAWALSAAPVLLVIAALTALHVILEDIYYWFAGGKKTLMGKMFGTWEEALDRVTLRFRVFIDDIKKLLNGLGFSFELDETLPGGAKGRKPALSPDYAERAFARDSKSIVTNLGSITNTFYATINGNTGEKEIHQLLTGWKKDVAENLIGEIRTELLADNVVAYEAD